MKRKAKRPRAEAQEGELFDSPAVDFDAIYEDEVDAAERGVLFQPGYVPQKGRKANILDLDPPGQPHWLSGERRPKGGKKRP